LCYLLNLELDFGMYTFLFDLMIEGYQCSPIIAEYVCILLYYYTVLVPLLTGLSLPLLCAARVCPFWALLLILQFYETVV